MLNLVLRLIYALLIVLQTTIYALIKQVIPYRYRCKSVKGETVLVTGAGSGIGKLVAKKLAKLGAKLILIDIDAKGNESTADEILMDGGSAHTFTCDLSKKENIYKVADEIKKTVGDVDILINNAGIVTGKKFLESTDDAIERTMAINTMAHFWLAKCFLSSMLEKNHGHIVTLASLAGLYGHAGLCDYSASKYAAVGFNDSLRMELIRLNKTGIHVTCVCPYFIDTGMFDGAYSALIPLLKSEYTADKIVEAILTNQKQLILPRIFYLIYFFKGIFSVEAEEHFELNVLKTAYSMDRFIGRKKQ